MTPDTRKSLLAMLRAVDPASTAPLYLIDAAERGSGVRLAEGISGCTGPALWAAVRDAIGDAWRGPGCCIVVDTTRIQPLNLPGVVLHEYAHHLLQGEPVLALLAGMTQTARGELVRELVAANPAPSVTIECPAHARPWHNHGPEFVRVLVHLQRRAARAGWLATGLEMYPHAGYLLPSQWDFGLALGDEPDVLIGLPMVDVAKATPPAEFTAFSNAALADAERRFQATEVRRAG